MTLAATLERGLDGFIRRRGRWGWLILFWALVTAASYAWRLHELEDHAHAMASQRGRLIFEMVETTRLWASQHGGVYAPVTGQTPPNPYLDVPEKVISTPSGKLLTKINPAYMTRQLGELIAQESDLRIHLTSLKPINPGNIADPWEREALAAFETSRQERVSIVGADGAAVFRYMAPLEVKKPCLACHEKQGYRLGDVRGGISVTFPASYVLGIIDAQKRDYLVIHIVAFVLMSLLALGSLSLIRRHLLALEAARGELVASEKMASLGRMVAGFAHEVNTPIGVAVGAVSQSGEVTREFERLLDRDEVGEDELRGHLAVLGETQTLALANLQRAAALVQSFKRTAVDQASDTERDYELAELINDVLRSMNGSFKKTRIEIAADCPSGVRLFGHAGALEQVLTNLLQNSHLHAYADGSAVGRIAIVARRDRDRIRIDYADDGAGMTAETLAHAFEPFYTTRRGKGGSGLGLYIVYNLITTRLGGSIACQSEAGRGTRFVIDFPVRTGPVSAKAGTP